MILKVNRAQPGLDRGVSIYKTLHRTHGGEAGMWTQVIQPGSISDGDVVEVTEAVPHRPIQGALWLA